MLRRRFLCLCLLLFFSAFACARESDTSLSPNDFPPGFSEPAPFEIRLSEGDPGADPGVLHRPQTATLPDSEVEQILSRLGPFGENVPDDETKFPTLQSGPRITLASDAELFPPVVSVSDDKQSHGSSRAQLIRVEPLRKVPIARRVWMTFDRPMFERSPPDTEGFVSITPRPKGAWRWVGKKTLSFEPEGDRLPMATQFRVAVHGDVEPFNEDEEHPKSWPFETPPPKLVETYPSSGARASQDQIMFMAFDQKIDPERMIKFLSVESSDRTLPLELVDVADVEEQSLLNRIERAGDGQFLLFRATQELPYDSRIDVTLARGAPSAEGPLPTADAQSSSFRTVGPLTASSPGCRKHRDGCERGAGFRFDFSNAIVDDDIESHIAVSPAIPDMTVTKSDRWIEIDGTKSGQRYTVTLSDRIVDRHGQQLGGERVFHFEMRTLPPELFGFPSTMVVADPHRSPGISVYTTNYAELDVKLYRVEPREWDDYLHYLRDRVVHGRSTIPEDRLLASKRVQVSPKIDQVVETRIDVADVLDSASGNLYVEVRPTRTIDGVTMPNSPRSIQTWVQVTPIGLDVFAHEGGLLTWATDLKSGEPLADVTVIHSNSKEKSRSDDSGVATLDHPDTDVYAEYVLAKHGESEAFLPASQWRDGWDRHRASEQIRWSVIDVRGTYRPGEIVSVKGWVRLVGNKLGGDVRLTDGIPRIDWVAVGPQREELARGSAALTEVGGFNFEFELPGAANHGKARIEMTLPEELRPGHTHRHSVEIQEFRTPEFEVSTTVGAKPIYAGSSAVASVNASYYSGGPLSQANVEWRAVQTESNFRPPNLPEFQFGTGRSPSGDAPNDAHAVEPRVYAGTTDFAGTHYLRTEFSASDLPIPRTVTVTASVADANRQVVKSETSFVVHPAEFYVGLKTERSFGSNGKVVADVIAADVDGNLVAGRPVTVWAVPVDAHGTHLRGTAAPQSCEVVSRGRVDDASRCTFDAEGGASYRIVASTVDDQTRRHYSEIRRWVSGADVNRHQMVQNDKVEIIPDKESYRPGETAELLIVSPFFPAEGLVTLEREGIVEYQRISMNGPTTVLDVPIKSTFYPNLFVNVLLVGEQRRVDVNGKPVARFPMRSVSATGKVDLSIPPERRTLQVALHPASEELEPGTETRVDVQVRDSDGVPVPEAEVALLVVDEAHLALSDYELPDPIERFYPHRSTGTSSRHTRQLLQLTRSPDSNSLRSVAFGEQTNFTSGPLSQLFARGSGMGMSGQGIGFSRGGVAMSGKGIGFSRGGMGIFGKGNGFSRGIGLSGKG